MDRREAVMLMAGGLIPKASGHEKVEAERVAWVGCVLERMMTIQVGMTREKLMTICRTEGGLSGALWNHFVSVDCPYFKVDVEFEAVGRPARDAEGRETSTEDARDRIVKVSRPYLQFSIMD